jgi:hypothetical protein
MREAMCVMRSRSPLQQGRYALLTDVAETGIAPRQIGQQANLHRLFDVYVLAK